MKKVMMIAAVAAVLTACGGANDGDATTDTTTTMPMESPTLDSVSSSGSQPFDSVQDTSGFSSSPTNEGSRRSTPGGSTNQNDSTRQ